LGELLHYKFFVKNEHWHFRKPLGRNPNRSIPDLMVLLNAGVAELEQATAGKLLGNPQSQFTALVEEVLSEEANK